MDFRMELAKERSDMVHSGSRNNRASSATAVKVVFSRLGAKIFLSRYLPFRLVLGLAGTSNKTVKLPKNFTLLGPGPGYTCSPAKIVPSTVSLSPDHRQKSQAMSKFPFSASIFPRLLVILSAATGDSIWTQLASRMYSLNLGMDR
ncbi:hypothetical protein P3S67_026577 [Capsicum chacoense]